MWNLMAFLSDPRLKYLSVYNNFVLLFLLS